MKKCSVSNKKSILFFMLVISIYFLRILNLDQDLPPWGIGYYQPVDEGSYSLLALNYTHYGYLNPTTIGDISYEVNTPLQTRTNIFGNILSIISLSLFGNNYYGFRLGYVLLGCGNLFLYILILRKINNNSKCVYKNKLFIAFTALLLFDFMFFMCSRVVENSSVRMFFNLLIVYIWLINKENYKRRFLMIGFIAVCSVFFVYITNVFCILAIFLCIVNILIHKDKNCAFAAAGYSLIGGIIALILAELYYRVIWNSNIIEAFFGVIQLFSHSEGYEITTISKNIIGDVIQKFLAYWSSNSLLYNVPIVFFIFAIFPIIVKKMILKNDETVTLCVFFILSFLMQTIFSEDCIGRKIISIYPIFLILVYYLIINWEEIQDTFSKWNRKYSIGYTCYLVLMLMLCALIVYYRLYKAADRTNFDIDTQTRWTILLGCILVGLTFIFFVVTVNHIKLFNFSLNKISKNLVYITIIGLLFINISLIYRFCIKNVTFYERDAMRELDYYLSKDDVYVTGGGYQLSYCLYNQMKYIMVNDMADIQHLMESNENILLIDYECDSEGMKNYFDNYIFSDSNNTLEPIYLIKRNFMTFGQMRNFCLYKIKYAESTE